jgi:hypothetical protein
MPNTKEIKDGWERIEAEAIFEDTFIENPPKLMKDKIRTQIRNV